MRYTAATGSIDGGKLTGCRLRVAGCPLQGAGFGFAQLQVYSMEQSAYLKRRNPESIFKIQN